MEPKTQSCDPLTTEEVTALEYWEFLGLEMMIKGCVSGSPTEWPMLKHEAAELLKAKDSLIRTIRDRERELSEQRHLADNWRTEFANGGVAIAKITKERDELQRKLEECERRLNGGHN